MTYKRLELRRKRKEMGLKQSEVARAIHISHKMYSCIEEGTRTGSVDLWDALEDLFGVDQRILIKVTKIK